MLAALAGLVVASVLFALIGAGLLRSQSEVAARAELDRQARALAAIVSERAERAAREGGEFRFDRPDELQALVGPRTRLYLIGLDLSPGAARPNDRLPSVVAEQLSFPELERAGVQRIDFRLPGRRETLEASAAPVRIGGEVTGALLLARPPGEFVSAWPQLRDNVLIAAACGLGAALALAVVLTGRLTRPFRAMRAATRGVAEGNLDVRLAPTGLQDLDEVAAAFNRMVAELARRDGAARDFLMRVTHDLRTPLTAVRGHAAALADGVVPEEDVPRSLAAIEGEAARLEAMVADLLDLARLDARRFRLDPEPVAPGEVLTRAADAAEARAAAAGVALERRIAPLPDVVTDGMRVAQIVGNLLDNALSWAPPGGRVVLEAGPRPGGGLVASVSDSGPGVPEDQREAIFAPFHSRETPDGRRGTGLGLPISRQLARALGGDLRLEGGPGARFTLELPAVAGDAAAPAPPPHGSGAGDRRRG